MSNLVQFGCPACLKLLFKFDKKTGDIEYHIDRYSFESDDKNNVKYVMCPKCECKCEIIKNGLIKREMVEA